MLWIKIVFVLALMSSGIFCLKLTFERVLVTYKNTKYYDYVFVNVTRYGRRSDYYINVEFIGKYPVDNNVTIHIVFYEFIRNHYKRSFIEFHYKICDFFNQDPFLGKYLVTAGFKCPVKPAKYTLRNISLPLEDFPNVFPFEKGRIDIFFNVTETDEPLVGGELYLSFKNEVQTNKRG